jgi:AraC family L-rhamnose operon regulatory protein RhaS
MELFTTDKERHTGHQIPLWYNSQEAFSPEMGYRTRFRLILIESGTGILRLGERRGAFIAPALFCLNEKEQPELEQSQDLQAQALYFHPNVINSVFTFENVREEGDSFTRTERQDLYWLKPFVQREAAYWGCLTIGPVSTQRALYLFEGVNYHLANQDVWNWPCQARSFLLELLFLLERISAASPEPATSALSDSAREADPIVMYLHTNYQDKISVKALARKFHTNRTTLTEQFREATGVPVITYLIQLRIRLAALMLRDTTLTISEITDRVGFDDISHFGRMFRKHTGFSPTEYRQCYCWHKPRYWLPRQIVGEPWRSLRS